MLDGRTVLGEGTALARGGGFAVVGLDHVSDRGQPTEGRGASHEHHADDQRGDPARLKGQHAGGDLDPVAEYHDAQGDPGHRLTRCDGR
jgi:hypothetical protein